MFEVRMMRPVRERGDVEVEAATGAEARALVENDMETYAKHAEWSYCDGGYSEECWVFEVRMLETEGGDG